MPSSFRLISEYTRPLHLQTKTSPDLNPTLNKAGAFSVSYHTNSADSWPSSTIYCLWGLHMITIRCEDHSSSVQQVRAVDEGRQADRLPQHSSAPGPAFLARRSLETWASKAPSTVPCRSVVKVILTAHVPCQRKDWWHEVVNTRSAIGEFCMSLRIRSSI